MYDGIMSRMNIVGMRLHDVEFLAAEHGETISIRSKTKIPSASDEAHNPYRINVGVLWDSAHKSYRINAFHGRG